MGRSKPTADPPEATAETTSADTVKAVQDVVEQVVAATGVTPAGDDNDNVPPALPEQCIPVVPPVAPTPKKKRLCRFPGCTKVIKSQGHCQRHGAKAKRCKVSGCEKQAQGTHDGMCKRHWKEVHFPAAPAAPKEQPPPAEGQSVYDAIIPSSISYRPSSVPPKELPGGKMPGSEEAVVAALSSTTGDPLEPPPPPEGVTVMPLVAFLREGITREMGWHRNAERRARGMFPVASLSSQLEPWERQLALVEILLLSGGTPFANFRDLAHAWGREKGFHNLLATSVCERRGEVDRKRRSDAGKSLTEAERQAYRSKKAKTSPSEDEEADLKIASVEEMVEEQVKKEEEQEGEAEKEDTAVAAAAAVVAETPDGSVEV